MVPHLQIIFGIIILQLVFVIKTQVLAIVIFIVDSRTFQNELSSAMLA